MDFSTTDTPALAAAVKAAFDTAGSRVRELETKLQEHAAEILELKQKHGRSGVGGGSGVDDDGVAAAVQTIMADEGIKAMQAGRAKSAIIPLERKTIISTPTLGSGQALVGTQRVGIVAPAERRLYVRSLLPQGTTDQAAVEFTQESSATFNARPQGDVSPVGYGEGEIKGESGLTFTNQQARCITIAHWIPASAQVLQDAQQLQNHISNRLIYGLLLEEEDQLLNGNTGANGLDGLIGNAATYNRGSTNDSKLVTLRKAVTQLALADAVCSGIVVHPSDWEEIETATDTTGQYIVATLNMNGQAVAWRVPVAVTRSISAGTFLAGDFNTAAQIWDRQQVSVEISREHSDYFTRNLVAIRCESRLALTVYRPNSMVTGSLEYTG